MAIAARDFRELRLDGMSRNFGILNALKGVNLTVRRGEFIALLGPSGCGKSTALNCLAGLLNLSGGSVWLDSTRIDQLKPEARGFGMVFQNYALFPHMSVRKNIGFGLAMQGAEGGNRAQGRRSAFDSSASATRPKNCRDSSRAASSSAWPSRAPSSSSRRWC